MSMTPISNAATTIQLHNLFQNLKWKDILSNHRLTSCHSTSIAFHGNEHPELPIHWKTLFVVLGMSSLGVAHVL